MNDNVYIYVDYKCKFDVTNHKTLVMMAIFRGHGVNQHGDNH